MLRRPLQQPYDGPFKVLQRKDKVFFLDINGKRVSVSIDRCKPAFFLNTEDLQLPQTKNETPATVEPNVTASTPTQPSTRSGRKVHLPTRRLAEGHLGSRRPFGVLPLTPTHRRLRLEWYRARGNWTAAEWNQIVFSDESRFNISSDDNRVRVWRLRGERFNPAFVLQRHTAPTPGVMVWGDIAYNTRSPLVLIRGTMTALRHVHDILQPHVLPLMRGIFHQDNGQPYTSRRRPVLKPLLLALDASKHRQFTKEHKDCPAGGWKRIVWSNEFRLQLQHADGRADIWRKQIEGMSPTCIAATL
ncbi:transposable element Tcb2 transposase [Trichonephila clavipes]|nr:transposable element Tcb2 transposase [Trichonephila clavipes]